MKETTHHMDIPCQQTTITTYINSKNKVNKAKQNKEYYNTDHMDNQSLYIYTSSSTKEGRTGAGVVGNGQRKEIDRRKSQLGQTMNNSDAELIAISKATKTANQHIQANTKQIWIFTENKINNRRIAAQNNKPGQQCCLESRKNIRSIEDQGVKVEIHWVPRHQIIPGNNKAG